MVTADKAELRAALRGLAWPPAHSCQRMTSGLPPASADEYPQAVAEDYPGWGVTFQDGQWTAWCPAITVHATTAGGLRAAIDRAITSDDHR